MPTVHVKGQPHEVITSSAGHFNGMHVAAWGVKREEVWYRGDDYDAALAARDAETVIVAAERDKYRAALEQVRDLFNREDIEILDFLQIAEDALT
jgi:hypothetical protein